MRPGQNKRMRGRNNNRKGPNPLTRSFESNGPDVKIRGTAQHVAEKYLQLARDANSSGDPVMAESYLQHAEHYFRLIAAAQQAQQQTNQNRQHNQPSETNSQQGDSSFDDDLTSGGMSDRFAAPTERAQAMLNQPQPSIPAQGNPFDNGQAHKSANAPQQDQEGASPDVSAEGNSTEGGGRSPSQGRGNRRNRNNDNRRGPRPPRQQYSEKAVDDSKQPTLSAFITGNGGGAGERSEPSGGAVDDVADAVPAKPVKRRRQTRSPQNDEGSEETKVPVAE